MVVFGGLLPNVFIINTHSTRSVHLFFLFLVGNTGSAYWDMHGMHACDGREDAIVMIFLFWPTMVFFKGFFIFSPYFLDHDKFGSLAATPLPSRHQKKHTISLRVDVTASTRSLGIRYLSPQIYHHNQTIPEVTHSKKLASILNMTWRLCIWCDVVYDLCACEERCDVIFSAAYTTMAPGERVHPALSVHMPDAMRDSWRYKCGLPIPEGR